MILLSFLDLVGSVIIYWFINTLELGTVSQEKTAVLLDFVQITLPPPSQQFRQLVQLFPTSIENQDLKITLYYYMPYNTLYIQLKNSLKLKLLAFWREQTPFIDRKSTYEKVTKNLGRALPPSFGQNPKEQQFFSRETVPYLENKNANCETLVTTVKYQ